MGFGPSEAGVAGDSRLATGTGLGLLMSVTLSGDSPENDHRSPLIPITILLGSISEIGAKRR